MRRFINASALAAGLALLPGITGCSPSKPAEGNPPPAPAAPVAPSSQNAPASPTAGTPPALPAPPAVPTAPANLTPPPPPPAPSASLPATSQGSVSTLAGTALDFGSKFLSAAKNDPTLQSIGGELVKSAQELARDQVLKGQLDPLLENLGMGNGPQALAVLQKLGNASLTPAQTQSLKQVGQLASAYLVQDNFAGIAGLEGDVGSLVQALRTGDYTAAIAPLQKLSQSNKLTQGQKDLVLGIADRYAPSVRKAGAAVKQGLDVLNSFKK